MRINIELCELMPFTNDICDKKDLTDQRRSDSFSARRLGGYEIDRASRLSHERRINQRRGERFDFDERRVFFLIRINIAREGGGYIA